MDANLLIASAGLALLATVNVGLWTLRVALAASGRRIAAAVAAGLEAVLFALVFGTVVGSLDDPVRVAGYAVGVAGGTLLGIVADERLSHGQSLVRIVVRACAGSLPVLLRERGWPVTVVAGEGSHGPVTVLLAVVDDAAVPRLDRDLRELEPGAFRTVERLRSASTRPRGGRPDRHERRTPTRNTDIRNRLARAAPGTRTRPGVHGRRRRPQPRHRAVWPSVPTGPRLPP